MTAQRAKAYLNARRNHPAWQLLASTKGPLLLSCLKTLFSDAQKGLDWAPAELALADTLKSHVASGDIESSSDDFVLEARRELRQWIKRGLILEREGKIIATDALEVALSFVESLDNRIMTSTASRLSIVQREVDNLDANLNPSLERREAHLRSKISLLEAELAAVQQGELNVLGDAQVQEAIREVFTLASSLRGDFRRVEDSYRDADQRLRKSIISEQNNRGDIVDKLLDSHDALLKTPEGQVFNSFHQQLGRTEMLEKMKLQLRNIVNSDAAKQALSRQQQNDLRWLLMRLVGESQQVIRARARSERDVKGFIKTGLAAEHHRVGELLGEVFTAALNIDWSKQATRRSPSPLPPLAIAQGGLPVLERLRFKAHATDSKLELDLLQQHTNLNDIDDDFWASFDGLDREAFLKDTHTVLAQTEQPMSIASLADALPPSHDLEAISLWLTVAIEAEVMSKSDTESVDISQPGGNRVRFEVPKMALTAEALKGVNLEV